jgi:DNA-binding protein YbaB
MESDITSKERMIKNLNFNMQELQNRFEEIEQELEEQKIQTSK